MDLRGKETIIGIAVALALWAVVWQAIERSYEKGQPTAADRQAERDRHDFKPSSGMVKDGDWYPNWSDQGNSFVVNDPAGRPFKFQPADDHSQRDMRSALIEGDSHKPAVFSVTRPDGSKVTLKMARTSETKMRRSIADYLRGLGPPGVTELP